MQFQNWSKSSVYIHEKGYDQLTTDLRPFIKRGVDL